MLIQKEVSNNNGPGSTGRGRRESAYLWLSITAATVQSQLESGQLARSDQSGQLQGLEEVHSCHIEGDLRLCWSDEDGPGGVWSWAGSGAPSACGTLICEIGKQRGPVGADLPNAATLKQELQAATCHPWRSCIWVLGVPRPSPGIPTSVPLWCPHNICCQPGSLASLLSGN